MEAQSDDNVVMAHARVAVFTRRRRGRPASFVGWASLVGPRIAVLHALQVEPRLVPDETPSQCVVYQGGKPKESLTGSVQWSRLMSRAPLFVFLDSGSLAPVTTWSDPRLEGSDQEISQALWEFVAAEAKSDPVKSPKLAPITATPPVTEPAVVATAPLQLQAARPWWCKLFRSGPGC